MSTAERQITNPMTRMPVRRDMSAVEVVRHADSRGTSLIRPGKFTCLGYRSAAQLGRDGTYPMPGSEDWHTAFDRPQLVNQSLQFYRDNGLYRGLIDRAVNNAVGDGYGQQARTSSKEWNVKHERLWRDEFAEEPEARGLLTWAECQRMALAELLKTGDHLTLLLEEPEDLDGKVQLIDSDRIAGGEKDILANGVSTDERGRPTKFWISPYGMMGQVDPSAAKSIDAKDVAWIALIERPSQTRGMPACQAAFPMIHRISDVCDSEALAWQILSRVALRLYHEDAATLGGLSIADPDKLDETQTSTGEVAVRVHEFDSALIFHALTPGDKIEGVERNIPGQNFPDAIRMFLRLMGLPIGMPLELILLDFSQTNYSSIRGCLEQAFAQFRYLQGLIEKYSRRIRNHWTDRMIVQKKLTARPDAHRHEWIRPTFPWLDELKEAQAWGAKLDRGLSTHAIACKSLNMDRDELMEAREAEIRNALEIAQRLEGEFPGQSIPWQMFAGLRAPGGSSPAPDVAAEPRSPENEPRQPREPSEPE